MRASALSLALLAGCCTSPRYDRPADAGEPWDTAYLIDADPSEVTDADLRSSVAAREHNLARFAEVLGVLWEPLRSDPALASPDMYGRGGDAAIFTGFLLAARAWKYGVTGDESDRAEALRALDDIYLLTHAAGRGVIARCAFPAEFAAKWSYPEAWQSRIDSGFVGGGPPLTTTLGTDVPATVYYTRGTKDQLTGIVMGLAVAWKTIDLPAAKQTIAQITLDLVRHLQAHDWLIRDANGANDTNADHVAGLQRTQLLALYRVTAGTPEADSLYRDAFAVADAGDSFGWGNNLQQYFSWNLRFTRAFTVWLLAEEEEDKATARRYVRQWLWPHVEDHQNPWFELIRNVMTGRRADDGDVPLSLRSAALKPIRGWASPYAGQEHKPAVPAVLGRCTGAWVLPPHLRKATVYFTWTKFPWDTGHTDKTGAANDTGLSLLLPYWGVRYFTR